MDEVQVTLGQRILLQISKRHLMPFERFGAMPHFTMSMQILLDGSLYRQTLIVLL
jgi:hypothetical protein